MPEVSCTIRPTDSSYAQDACPKSWCAANVAAASATAPVVAQKSPFDAANARPAIAISKVARGGTNTQPECSDSEYGVQQTFIANASSVSIAKAIQSAVYAACEFSGSHLVDRAHFKQNLLNYAGLAEV